MVGQPLFWIKKSVEVVQDKTSVIEIRENLMSSEFSTECRTKLQSSLQKRVFKNKDLTFAFPPYSNILIRDYLKIL